MKEKIFLLDGKAKDSLEKTKIKIWGKSPEGETKILEKDFSPSFLVLPKDLKKAKEEILRTLKEKNLKVEKIETKKLFFQQKELEFLEIFCFKKTDPQKIREEIKFLEEKRLPGGQILEEFEYQINPFRKFLMQEKIDGCSWIEVEGEKTKEGKFEKIKVEKIKALADLFLPKLKILAFDIETIEEKGEKKIIMVSFFGENFQKVITFEKACFADFVEIVSNEKEVLKKIEEIFQRKDPDIVLTYYGDSFDFLVLKERSEKLSQKINLGREKGEIEISKRAKKQAFKIEGRVHIDLFNFVQNILAPNLQTEILTLDAVCAEILKDKKIELSFQELLESWRKKKNLEKLAEYCLKDSELTFKLGKLFLPQIFEFSRVVGQTIFDVSRMTPGQLVEWYLSKKAKEMNFVIPNQPKFEEILERKKKTFVGGFVKEPVAGIHENIAVLDFRSLYPSLIVSFNISPEVLNCACCQGDGFEVPELNYWFCKKNQGFVPKVLKEIIEKRVKIKEKIKGLEKDSLEYAVLNNQQFALKIVANATYGYFGFSGSKWYSKECAEACTAFGRYWIKKTIEKAQKEGFEVLYADTDSVFLKEKNIEEKAKDFLEKINKEFPGILQLELQGIFERGIFLPKETTKGVAKKRYALATKEGELLIRGLETVRRDWCYLAREVQRKVLEFLLLKKDLEGAKNYVRETIKKLKEGKILLKDLVIYEEITKPLKEYKLISPHLMAARKLKEAGIEVGEGQVIMFVIEKGKGLISEKAVPLELAKKENLDIDYYIFHQIIPAAMRVLKIMEVREEELLEEKIKMKPLF